MSFNLLTDPFLPVRTRDGGARVLTLTGLPDAEDALEPDWPRPDFNAAAMELLIGIAALAMQPKDADAWADIWKDGPDGWADRLTALAPAFELLGDGPRFLQEHGGIAAKNITTTVEALLVDSASENSQDENKDLLTHRARYPQLGLPTAAMALYALQTYAPSGGRSYFTALRGGGPLTTLVIPQAVAPVPLWRKVWANVPHVPQLDLAIDLARVCPWMRPGVVPGKISQGHESFHQLHAFFGMPRRLWLVGSDGICAMTGQRGEVITGFFQKQNGHDYDIWKHPLSPYKRGSSLQPERSPHPRG